MRLLLVLLMTACMIKGTAQDSLDGEWLVELSPILYFNLYNDLRPYLDNSLTQRWSGAVVRVNLGNRQSLKLLYSHYDDVQAIDDSDAWYDSFKGGTVIMGWGKEFKFLGPMNWCIGVDGFYSFSSHKGFVTDHAPRGEGFDYLHRQLGLAIPLGIQLVMFKQIFLRFEIAPQLSQRVLIKQVTGSVFKRELEYGFLGRGLFTVGVRL